MTLVIDITGISKGDTDGLIFGGTHQRVESTGCAFADYSRFYRNFSGRANNQCDDGISIKRIGYLATKTVGLDWHPILAFFARKFYPFDFQCSTTVYFL